jgi:hypothetical protein
MRFRLKAFGLHLLASACALTLVLGGLYLGWYHWPGWYLTAVTHLLLVVGVVDLVLGPTLTLIIANPKKSRRELARDIAVIGTVQIAALLYGAWTLWQGRPLYYTFSADRLETVRASDISAEEVVLGQKENPALTPHWYSLPRWVWAPLPENPDKVAEIVSNATFGGGADVIDMPRYFKPWEAGLLQLRAQLVPVGQIKYFSRQEQKVLQSRITKLGFSPDDKNSLMMWGGSSRRLVAIFDPDSLKIKALIRPD